MSIFGVVSAEKEAALLERMQKLGVLESDLEESFIRSSGPGGQNVNKVSSCVFLRHRPSGVAVKCQRERSQALNRFFARRLLLDELERRRNGFVAAKRSAIEKLRRQKRKRSKRAKEKMLEGKRLHSQKKQNRGKVGVE